MLPALAQHVPNFIRAGTLGEPCPRWMNERLYAVCAEIPDEARKHDTGAFFKSIHGTLNHLLVGEKLSFIFSRYSRSIRDVIGRCLLAPIPYSSNVSRISDPLSRD